MSFFEYYYINVLRQEFLTKYVYKNIYQVPKLKKVVINFHITQTSLKNLLPLLSGLFLISSQKPFLVANSTKLNLSLKLKSGLPVSCKVHLRGSYLYFFLEKLTFSVLPRLREFSTFLRGHILSIVIPNLFVFKEIEKDYEHFPDLPSLHIAFVFKSNNYRETIDFLTALRFPLKKRLKF